MSDALDRALKRIETPDPIAEIDSFYSKPISYRQARSVRSARREAQRSERMLRRAIGDDLLEQEMNGGRYDNFLEAPFAATGAILSRAGRGLATATQPLFDLLQMGQFTTAGAALELVNGGNGYEALRRASSEFVNALPFLDEMDAEEITGVAPTRASWRDVLKKSDFKPLENDRHNEYATAAAGLVLDIVLDPMTWAGGVAMKAVGGGLKSAMLPFLDAPGVSQVRNLAGRKFSPGFEVRELVRKNPALQKLTAEQKDTAAAAGIELSENAGEGFLGGLATRRGEIAQESVDVSDLAIQLRAGLPAAEARFLSLYLDQPEHFERIVGELTYKNPEAKELLMEKFSVFKKEYKRAGELDVKAGVLDPLQLEADYNPGRFPVTGTSEVAFKDAMDRIGIPETIQQQELSALVGQQTALLGEGGPMFGKSKKFDTTEQRVLAAVGTELDPGVNFALRGLEGVRSRATKRFVDAVLTDERISKKITDPSLLQTIKKGGGGHSLEELMSMYGKVRGKQLFDISDEFAKSLGTRELGVWRPFRQEVADTSPLKKLKPGSKFIDDEHVSYSVGSMVKRGEGKGQIRVTNRNTGMESLRDPDSMVQATRMSPAYVMPKEFIKELNLADNIVNNASEGRKFFEGLRSMQNVWKGWALVSPGYHMRNHWSNMFNNALAGVTDPKDYSDAFRLVWGQGDNVSAKVKVGNEYKVLSGQELVREARKYNIVESGLFGADIPEQVETKLFDRMYRSKGGGKAEFAEALEGVTAKRMQFQMGEDAAGAAITRRDLIKGVTSTAPIKGDIGWLSKIFGSNNTLLHWNRYVGKRVENTARMTHWLNRMKKGDSPEAAALSAKRYLFDYAELTEFERDVMKLTLPFYTWMRKNVPLQITEMVRNPGRYGAMTGKPIGAIESLSEEWSELPTPDYFEEIHAVRMPKEFAEMMQKFNERFDDAFTRLSGNPQVTESGLQPTYVNPNFPFQDLNRLNFRDTISGMSPLFKLPIEMLTGQDDRGYSIFLDAPIARYSGEPAEGGLLGTPYTPSKMTQHALETIAPPIGKLQRLIDRAKGGQVASQLASEFTGIKALQVDVGKVKRNIPYKRRNTLRTLRQKYKDRGLLQ